VYRRSAYYDLKPIINFTSNEQYTFNPGEEKTIELQLPAQKIPESYYALSESSYTQLKNNLLAYRKIAGVYDVPTAACGRFPTAITIMDELYPAYAYLALSKSTPDVELLAAFERLYQPTVNPVLTQVGRTVADITFKSTLGEMELCLKAHALGVKSEVGPKSQDYYPFAGLHISRDSLRHVSIKGFSKYIWDFESTITENPYGRYLCYGQIEYS
jgi:chondroitin-sulfate-ABC endolyase/exolyase